MPKFEDGSYGSLTGIALIGKVLAGRCGMKYTRAAVGNGAIPADKTPKTMPGPAGYVMDAQIAAVSNPIDGECQVTVEIKSDDVETGFYATSVVLYAEDPDDGEVPYTYLLLETEPEWIRPASSIVGKLATFDLVAAVGAIDTVTAVVNSKSIAGLLAAQPNTPFVSLKHVLGTCPQIMLIKYQYGAGIGGAGEGPAGGSDAVQIPARADYRGKSSLTIFTTEAAARSGTPKVIRRISDYEYIVTYEGDDTSAVYIQLIPTPKARLDEHLPCKLAALQHDLGFRPLVMAGALQYGAGMDGAGEGPAGGTDMEQIPIRTIHHDSGSLTIYAAEDVARPDAQKEIRKIGEREYTVTYRGDENRSVYIRLI